VRTSLIVAALLLSTAACADAPITAADLQADGQLREQASVPQLQSSHALRDAQSQARVAERLLVTGLLAAQAEGPLEDTTRFSLDSEGIHLHLRADGLSEPRPVTFVWQHGEQRRETMGFLQPSETISLAATLPLAHYVEEGFAPAAGPGVEPDPALLAGAWKVEVYSTDATGRSLVFEREFEVLEREAYELWLTELAAVAAAQERAPGVAQ
jgi:hypothetical protein